MSGQTAPFSLGLGRPAVRQTDSQTDRQACRWVSTDNSLLAEDDKMTTVRIGLLVVEVGGGGRRREEEEECIRNQKRDAAGRVPPTLVRARGGLVGGAVVAAYQQPLVTLT